MSRRVELIAAALDVDEETAARAALHTRPASGPPVDVDTEEGEELDGLLLLVMADDTHPRQTDASVAYLLRHGAGHGYTPEPGAPLPPRTIVEWNAWTPERGLADA